MHVINFEFFSRIDHVKNDSNLKLYVIAYCTTTFYIYVPKLNHFTLIQLNCKQKTKTNFI